MRESDGNVVSKQQIRMEKNSENEANFRKRMTPFKK
jgi:hypothetical protein